MQSIHHRPTCHPSRYRDSVRLPGIRDLFPELLHSPVPSAQSPKSPSQPLLRLVTPCLPLSGAPSDSGCSTRSASYPSNAGSHSKSRRHVCPECQKRFNRPSSLSIHLHTHTGERPYTCPHPGCLRTFNVSSNMRRHFRSHEADPAAGQPFAFSSPSPSPTSSCPLSHSSRYPAKPY